MALKDFIEIGLIKVLWNRAIIAILGALGGVVMSVYPAHFANFCGS